VVYSEQIDRFPPHHREILEGLGQGDFHLVLGKPNSDYTNAVLYQRSHTDPSKVFGWTDTIEGNPDEVKAEVERFHRAGVPVELAMGPQHKDYDKWAKHFGLSGHSEEPEQYGTLDQALKYVNETHADFHNRILENPAETTPALVYADWLEEKQEKPAHAELIRKHVEQKGTGAEFNALRQVPYVFGNELSYHPHETAAGLFNGGVYGNNSSVSLEAGQKNPSHSLTWSATLPPEEAEDLHKRLVEEGSPNDVASPNTLPVGWKKREGGLEVGEAVSEHFSASEKPLRYSAVPDHEVHEDYAPNGIAPRIGHSLKQLAQEDSTTGALAEGILRTGDHSILPILADRLEETEHPLALAFDWRHAPRAIRIDRALHRQISQRQVRHPDGHRVPLTAGWVLADIRDGVQRPAFSRRKALLAARLAQADATTEDVVHSLFRLDDNRRFNRHAERLREEPETLTDPTTGDVSPPTHLTHLTLAKLQQMNLPPVDPYQYPDTRKPNKRVYGSWRAPAGGMVVQQSPLAVSGQWAEGGEFVNDLQKMASQPVEYKRKRLTVEYLRQHFRKRKAKGGAGVRVIDDTAGEGDSSAGAE